MTGEKLKNKCTERAKIFQQAMESCKSSSPMDCIEWFADRIAELEKELQNWKDEWQEQVQKANDEGYARTLQTMQLTKAKEIIKNLVEFDSSYKDDEEYQRKSELYDKMWEEAEQFINDFKQEE